MIHEAVLPITNNNVERRNVERASLLLKSLSYFWNGSTPLTLRIVVPDAELADVRGRLGADHGPKLSVVYIRESNLDPKIANIGGDLGYAKQMLIKLAHAGCAVEDNYLVLDSDCVACKPFDERTFWHEGRVVTQWAAPTLGEWWVESAGVLGWELDSGFFNEVKMHVTPQVLNRGIVAGLTDYLTRQRFAGKHWIDGLMERYTGDHPRIWTEYTLYHLYAARTDLLYKVYTPNKEIPPERALHCAAQNIWGPADLAHWSPERALSVDPGHFMVLQSITAESVDFARIRDRWLAAARAAHPDYPA
jgi:hypothetical protein